MATFLLAITTLTWDARKFWVLFDFRVNVPKQLGRLSWFHVHVRYMSSPVRQSVVCRLLRWCTLLRRLKLSAMFLHHLVPWPPDDIQVKFYWDLPRETPPSGELNTRVVAEYSDFGPVERYISETVQDGSYQPITNFKSHMRFRLVPNSVTLDDLEQRNSPSLSVISPNSVAFGADYIKVFEDTPIHSLQQKCRPKNLIGLVKVRYAPIAIENLTNKQP